MHKQVSIIIPYLDELDILLSNLEILTKSSLFPSEIIIVNTGVQKLMLPSSLDSKCADNGIRVEIIDATNAFPGQARNIGLYKCSFDIVAFLDSKTIPSLDWLEMGLKQLAVDNINIVWGKTIFKADSYFERIFRACSYGAKPLTTVPGSIFNKDALLSTGKFIESVRAGEDADWIARVKAHNIQSLTSHSLIEYRGLAEMTITNIIRKWYRNYLSASGLNYIKGHKDIYFYFISIIFIVLAFNWNSLSYDSRIGGWNLNSLVYIPNITKIITGATILGYLFFRNIYLPLRKGIKITFIFLPHNLISIIFISFILDVTKLLAFIHAKTLSVLSLRNRKT
jgi:hypothetical protein